MSNYLREWGFPKWSFQVGMGQNFLPLTVGDPFNWIMYFLGKDFILPVIFYVEFSKILVSGILFHLFLKELDIHPLASILGGLLFAFSSYLVIGGSWFQASNEAVCAALLLLSLALFFKRNNWYLVPVAFMMIAIYLTFWLYFYTIMTGIYATVHLTLKSKFRVRSAFDSYLKLAGLALFGMLMGSIFFFPNILQYLESPRVGGDASYFNKLANVFIFQTADIELSLTTIFRFFSNDLQSTGSEFYGWYNYFEAPMYYCGLISLFLFPQVFSIITRNKKGLLIGLILFGIVPLVFPYFRHLIWLFTGDYFRTYSFFLTIILIISSQTVLSHYLKGYYINWKILFFTFCFFMLVLFLPKYFYIRMEQDVLTNVQLILLALFLIMLLFQFKSVINLTKLLLFSIVIYEVIALTSFSVEGRVPLSESDVTERNFYNDTTIDAVKYIHEIDSSFYRIERNYSSSPAQHESLNDAMAQGYFGTSSYDSFNQLNYVRFLEEVDIIQRGNEIETRWALGLFKRPLLQSLASVKYFLIKQETQYLENFGYYPIGKIDSLTILLNNNYLPLGFSYSHYLSYDQFKKTYPNMKDALLLKTAVIESVPDLTKYTDLNAIDESRFQLPFSYKLDDYAMDVAKLRADTLIITNFTPNQIEGDIDLEKSKILFFSIPYDAGWTATVNGVNTELHRVNLGFMGLFLVPGQNKIILTFEPRLLKLGASLSVIFIILYLSLLFLYFKRNRKLPKLAM